MGKARKNFKKEAMPTFLTTQPASTVAGWDEKEYKKREAANAVSQQSLDLQTALVTGILTGSKSRDEFLIIADGSASMNGKPLSAALEGANALRNSASKAKSPQPSLALWGGSQLHWVTEDITDSPGRNAVDRKAGIGADLAPSIAEAQKIAAVTNLAGKKTHIILIGDGELLDPEQARTAIGELLTTNKKVTVDFVIMEPPHVKTSQMEIMAMEMQSAFPGQTRIYKAIDETGNHPSLHLGVKRAVMDIASDRLKTPASFKRSAPKP